MEEDTREAHLIDALRRLRAESFDDIGGLGALAAFDRRLVAPLEMLLEPHLPDGATSYCITPLGSKPMGGGNA